MEELLRIHDAIIGDEIAYLFSATMAAWLMVAVVVLFVPSLSRSQFGSRLMAITPNSLTTFGVLGTFTGILIGLLDFDVERIDASVPSLLAGLKIAFTTSIVGIAAPRLNGRFRETNSKVRCPLPALCASEGRKR